MSVKAYFVSEALPPGEGPVAIPQASALATYTYFLRGISPEACVALLEAANFTGDNELVCDMLTRWKGLLKDYPFELTQEFQSCLHTVLIQDFDGYQELPSYLLKYVCTKNTVMYVFKEVLRRGDVSLAEYIVDNYRPRDYVFNWTRFLKETEEFTEDQETIIGMSGLSDYIQVKDLDKFKNYTGFVDSWIVWRMGKTVWSIFGEEETIKDPVKEREEIHQLEYIYLPKFCGDVRLDELTYNEHSKTMVELRLGLATRLRGCKVKFVKVGWSESDTEALE